MLSSKRTLFIFLISIFLVTLGVHAQEMTLSDMVDQNIPQSWYEAPQKASEMNITEFNESPMLKERVEQGELPPVEERLPADPPVVEPYEDVGEYGGMVDTWGMALNDFDKSGAGLIMSNGPKYGRSTPDGTKVVSFLLEDWEFSNDKKSITFHLREGLKWSDGHLFTADDFIYWWDHEANNEDLEPTPPEKWDPPILDVEKKGEYTVVFHYDKPVPNQEGVFHSYMQYGTTDPSHYEKQFHPDFVDKEKLEEEAEDVGLDSWFEYYSYMTDEAEFYPERGERPTLRPYLVTERHNSYIIAERNPYYPFVDTEGNQLPYIDKIRLNLANDREMQVAKQSTGEADLAGRAADAVDLPLYRENEEKYGYKTLVYTFGTASIIKIEPNLTHKDEDLRDIFQDERFRKALSLSIDREEINEKVFFGMGSPRQLTHLPMSSMYEKRFAEAYADLDLEKANNLLDEMGMEDSNDDGYREMPNGDQFKPKLLYIERYGPATPILELVKDHWTEIGVNVELSLIDPSLFFERRMSGEYDISIFPAANSVMDLDAFRAVGKYFAPVGHASQSSWPLWSNWYETNGETGEEPPKDIKKLIEWAETLKYGIEEEDRLEAGKKLLEAQAENLWNIGLVALTPKPLIINENLKNIPEKGIWTDAVQRTQPLYPIQFYFDE